MIIAKLAIVSKFFMLACKCEKEGLEFELFEKRFSKLVYIPNTITL